MTGSHSAVFMTYEWIYGMYEYHICTYVSMHFVSNGRPFAGCEAT